MDTYFTLITAKGRPKLAGALIPGGAPFDLSFMAFGDGGGAAVSPVDNRSALVNEVHRRPVNSVEKDPDNPSWVVVRCVLPPEVGGWTVREVGLYDAAGDMVAYGNFPASTKPILAQGSGKELVADIYLEVGAGSNVTLQVNPSVVTATQKWVQQQIEQAKQQFEQASRGHRAQRHFLNQI